MGFTSLSRDDLSLHSWVPQAFPLRPKPASTYMLEGRDQDTEDTKPRAARKVLAGPEPAGCRLSPSATRYLQDLGISTVQPRSGWSSYWLFFLGNAHLFPPRHLSVYCTCIYSAPPHPRCPASLAESCHWWISRALRMGVRMRTRSGGPSGKKLAGRGWRKAVAPRLGERAAAALGGAEVQGWWPGCCGACELLQSCALLWRGGAG